MTLAVWALVLGPDRVLTYTEVNQMSLDDLDKMMIARDALAELRRRNAAGAEP